MTEAWESDLRDRGRVRRHPDSRLPPSLEALASASELLDWIDEAPALRQSVVQEKLARVGESLLQLEGRLPADLQPWFMFEWSRYYAYQGDVDRALQAVAQALGHKQTLLAQPGLVGRVRQMLLDLDQNEFAPKKMELPYRPTALASWQRLIQVLHELPVLLGEGSAERIKQNCVHFLSRLLQPHQIFWLEAKDSESPWEIVAYYGPPGYAVFSSTLLTRAFETGEFVSGPLNNEAYESLVLSEARGVLITLVPGVKAAIYLSHKQLAGTYEPEELEVLRLVAQIAGHHFEAEELHRQRLTSEREASDLRRQLGHLHQHLGVGLTWLDLSGKPCDSNPSFRVFHPDAARPIWAELYGPDQVQARRWFQECLARPGMHSEIFRYPMPDGEIAWLGYHLDCRTDSSHSLCLLQDHTAEHWESSVLLLERERHWLAAEIHDGPAQESARQALLGGPANLEAIRELIDWLSSPLHTGASPTAAIERLLATHLPEVPVQIHCQSSDWSPGMIVSYRMIQDLIEQLAERPVQAALEICLEAEGSLRGRLQGVDCSDYAPALNIESRIQLFNVVWSADEQGLRWEIQSN